ncbi:hypothetical protein [Ammoniphilus sp. CFH 90114]|uniref:LeuD/DmdB family oxidoreductase small subunit n=1 Tax=Ammoniphilus sp. CFH 90114 TaxID=2493665 RepID=UPI00100E0B20|nr:hypothetical protein [Ammoniphilus sp. CFH 90114]RXT00620.1 hypothetical protein EIZ39_25875 [Ammoniphilus sp. CFH 90114]
MKFEGKVHIVGDDINTDYIISSRRKRDSLDAHYLKQFFMEDIDSTLHQRIKDGDILVSGKNFGCGSAMEVAATVIQALGVRVIIAPSFARSFFRNGINNGLLLIEADTTQIQADDVVEVQLGEDLTHVYVRSRNVHLTSKPLPTVMQNIFNAGGIVPYFIKNNGTFIT